MPHKFPNDLRLRILGNKKNKKSLRLHGTIAECPVFLLKWILLKNKNWIFSVVRCFTWNLKFVSNILFMIVHENSFLLSTCPGLFNLESLDIFCSTKAFNTVRIHNWSNWVVKKVLKIVWLDKYFSELFSEVQFDIERQSSLV